MSKITDDLWEWFKGFWKNSSMWRRIIIFITIAISILLSLYYRQEIRRWWEPPPILVPAPLPAVIAPPTHAEPKVVLVDSDTRKQVLDYMESVLGVNKDNKIISPRQSSDWIKNIAAINNEHPNLVIVHLHTMRHYEESDQSAEETLFLGLRQLLQWSPKVQVIIYSSSFGKGRDPLDSQCALLQIAKRTATKEQSDIGTFDPLLRNLHLLAWSDRAAEKKNSAAVLQAAVSQALQEKAAPFVTPGECQQRTKLLKKIPHAT